MNLQPITPSRPRLVIPQACQCGADVDTTSGFAAIDVKGMYVCLRCTGLFYMSRPASLQALSDNQMREFRLYQAGQGLNPFTD